LKKVRHLTRSLTNSLQISGKRKRLKVGDEATVSPVAAAGSTYKVVKGKKSATSTVVRITRNRAAALAAAGPSTPVWLPASTADSSVLDEDDDEVVEPIDIHAIDSD